MVLAAVLPAALPIALFPHSRTTWIALDMFFNPPGPNPERYLRGREMDAASIKPK